MFAFVTPDKSLAEQAWASARVIKRSRSIGGIANPEKRETPEAGRDLLNIGEAVLNAIQKNGNESKWAYGLLEYEIVE